MQLESLLRGDTNTLIHPEQSLHQLLDRLLAEDAELRERVALMQIDGKQLTFEELNQRANQLACHLAQSVAQSPEDSDRIVAICLPHSIDLIVGLLAIFKSGSAYLPLDVNFPQDRVTHILKDSKPILLLTSGSVLRSSPSFTLAVKSNDVTVLDLETVPLDQYPTDGLSGTFGRTLATVLYTSGSTGIPKGVRLEHKTILHRLNWQWRKFPYSSDETGCCKTALTFVDSIAEIWGPLLVGRPLQLVPKDVTQDTERFIDLLDRCHVTRLVLVPSLLKAILTILKSRQTGRPLEKLKMWVCSGEVLTSQLLLEFYDVFPAGTIMCNFYGSTEVMGDVTYAAFDSKDQVNDALIENKVPIGKVLDNCVIYLLDSSRQLVEVGEVGEIYVAGAHLCSGYVNNREAERFIPNQIEDSPAEFQSMFRTGDYGRLVNGQIYYEGRADSQVKIRGHRVDLNEIITAVNKLEQVSFGTVLCYKAGEPEQEVVAFVTLKPGSDIQLVKKELKAKLVSYMMPSVVEIEEVPLLVNGKVDRQKLLGLFAQKQQQQLNSVQIENEDQLTKEEKALLKTIVSVTGGGSRPIQFIDNFFDIGGNSLNAVSVVTKLRDQGYYIDIATFLAAETLSDLVPSMKSNPKDISSYQCQASLTTKTYTAEMLQPSFKEEVVKIVGQSFSQKEVLAVLAGAGFDNFADFFDVVWEELVAADLSFVLKDQDGKIVSVAVNMDLFDEETIDPSKVSPELFTIFEFLDSLESPIKEKYFEKRTNLVLSNFMMATVQTATPAENVALIQQMEMENINIAKRKGFKGNMTTNTIELTRQVCEDLLDYKVLCEYQINQYVAPDGSKPFGNASDSTVISISLKYNDD